MQLYESPLRAAALSEPTSPRRLWIPSWVRAEPIATEARLRAGMTEEFIRALEAFVPERTGRTLRPRRSAE